jgi:hypothetical protein
MTTIRKLRIFSLHLLSRLCAFHLQGVKVVLLKSNGCSQPDWINKEVLKFISILLVVSRIQTLEWKTHHIVRTKLQLHIQ